MKKNPMAWAILTVIVLFFALFGWMKSAHAQPSTNYDVTFRFNRGYDTFTLDSAFAVLFDGTAAADSGLRVSYDTARYAGRKDTLTFIVNVSSTAISKTRNPSIMLCVYPSTMSGKPFCDEKSIAHLIHSVDTARYASATATVDTAAIARSVWDNDVVSLATRTVTSSASGTGAFSDSIHVLNSADNTPVGAGVFVWLTPNGGGPRLTALTDANGVAKFSVDTDTFLALLWSVGWQQVITPDTNKVPAVAVRDTMFMTSITPTPPSAPGLSSVTFTFYTSLGVAMKNGIVRYKLDAGSAAYAYHSKDTTRIFDPATVYFARTDANGQATINVVPNDSIMVPVNQVAKTKWQVWGYAPDGVTPLLGQDGVKITVPASATGLIYPKHFD